jgi:dihydroorotase
MFDLLIKSGRVIDPAQNIDDRLDVAISNDKIVKLAKDIPPKEGKEVVDAKDKLVTPGLIDIHCHVYESIQKFGADPDVAGVYQGVTTVVDGGSAGQATFGGFPRYVIPSYRTSIFCFLHLASAGQSVMPEIRDWKDVDVKATEAAIEANRDIIKGIKIRMVGPFAASDGTEVVKTAKTIAKKFGLPIMMHIGDPRKEIPLMLCKEILPLLEKGDILSHIYSANHGAAFPDGVMLPELKQAADRGVLMDIGHGHHFSYELAKKGMAEGVFPTTVGTDLTKNTLTEMVYGLTLVMTKILALGVDLKEVIAMSTINCARALGEQARIGSLKPGMNADVSVLELISGSWNIPDSYKQGIESNKFVSPFACVKTGKLILANQVKPAPMEVFRKKS